MQFNLGPGLDVLKAKATLAIDAQAENTRLAFITGGAGQAMEYQATEIEGKRALDALDRGDVILEADYPFIMAERAAYAANGVNRTFRSVAEEVVQLANAWAYVGSQIKALRRTAKIKIDNATTPAEVVAATKNIAWPTPGTV